MGGKTPVAIIINHESQSPFFLLSLPYCWSLKASQPSWQCLLSSFVLERWCGSQKWTMGRTHRWANDNEPRLCQMLYHLGSTLWIFNPLLVLHQLCSYRNPPGIHQVKMLRVSFVECTEKEVCCRFTMTTNKWPQVYKVDQALYFKQQSEAAIVCTLAPCCCRLLYLSEITWQPTSHW